MAYFGPSPIDFNNQPKSVLSGVGDTVAGFFSDIADARNSRADRDLAKKKTLADIAKEEAVAKTYAAQVEATNAKEKRLGMHEQIAFDQGQQDRQGKLVDDVTALAPNQPGAARARAMASQFMDPRTGRMAGVTFDQVPQGPAPVAPEAPQQPEPAALPSYIRVPTPERARAKAIHDALVKRGLPVDQPPPANDLSIESAGAEAAGLAAGVHKDRGRAADEQLQYDINKPAFDQKQADFKVQGAAYEQEKAHPKYALGFPSGQTAVINPQEKKNAQDAERAETAALLRRLASTPGTKAEDAMAVLRQAALIEAGVSNADKAPITNMAAQSASQDFKGGQQANQIKSTEKIQGGHDQAKIIAAGLHGKGGGGGSGIPDAGEARVLHEMDDALKPMTQKGGLNEMLQHSEGSLRTLQKEPGNPINWTNAIDAAIRTNTGRAAILSQYKLYTGKAAGLNDTPEQLWAGFQGAQLSDTQKANLLNSFKAANSELRQQAGDFNTKIHKTYDADPRVTGNKSIGLGYKAREHNTFGGLPGYGGQPGALESGQPAKAAPLTPEDQAAITTARARLAKNPGDGVARKVLDLHGLKE